MPEGQTVCSDAACVTDGNINAARQAQLRRPRRGREAGLTHSGCGHAGCGEGRRHARVRRIQASLQLRCFSWETWQQRRKRHPATKPSIGGSRTGGGRTQAQTPETLPKLPDNQGLTLNPFPPRFHPSRFGRFYSNIRTPRDVCRQLAPKI